LFAGNYVPKHFIPCNGQLFKRADYPKLSKLIGTEYGGDAEHFGTPNLPNVDDHAQWLMNAKSMRDYNDSIYPSGSIILGLKTLNPKGFKPCNGQLLPLNNFTNEILFANIGTSFGGDGRKNFGLPNYVHEDNRLGYFIAVDQEMPEEQDNDIVGRIWTYPYDARTVHSSETLCPTDGRFFDINTYEQLFAVIESTYGQNDNQFAIPKMQSHLKRGHLFIVTKGLLLMRD